MSSKLYSEDEAATLLGMTRRMLADRRRAGKISAIKDGHVIAYTAAHLTEYQKNHQKKSAASVQDIDSELLIQALRMRLGK